jgi:RNA polymerase sigma-70 factor, ECF subfamily
VSRWSEKRLLARALSGEREACVELIHGYHAPIYRLLARLCGDPHLAEDLTQETFAAGWANLKTFRGASSVGTWLHRIAYRKFVDWQRRAQRRVTPAAESSVDEVESPQLGPSEQALAREQSWLLNRAIGRLNPPERGLVVLHYLQGLSYRDMAEILEEPTGTLKWRTRQALENLRRMLEEERNDETQTTPARTPAQAELHRGSVTPASGAARA